MNFKIVSDSSSNVFELDSIPYISVPLKINASEKEYIDNADLDLRGMVDDLKAYKGKSGSSCPNVQEWLDAYQGADCIFGVTISRHLSGSYNAAVQAGDVYMEEHPGAKVFIFDSMSAGPELALIIEKLKVLIKEGLDFEAIRDAVIEYHNRLHTLFCLQSMTNLARNGRVNPAVAKIASALNIRVIGDANCGQLAPTTKPRGDKKALQVLVDLILKKGLTDGTIRIAHCFNPALAEELKTAVLAKRPDCNVIIEHTTALCSYYAEVGGLIIAWEGNYNPINNHDIN